LQNAIWLNEKRWTLEKVKTFNTSNSSVVRTTDPSVCGPGWKKGKLCEITRCAVVAALSLVDNRNTQVKIASTHMTGGRFADLNYQKFTGEKAYEAYQVLSNGNADIVVGDCNSHPSEEQVETFQAHYESPT
jgi:hypothetical protein